MNIILIDGRSGAGKSEFATALAGEWGAQLVRLDDIYPGWDGLDAASRLVPQILTQRTWRRWDWELSRAAETHHLDADVPLIVEGVGALSRASKPLARLALWIELDEPTRKARALARDDNFGENWERWAAQEDALIARENPRDLADQILDGSRPVAQLLADVL